ncbi:hypothetical protein BGZ57DRAFT_867140 [Hyaloscypha finlandica]|nr:hypothetical protein BGZ57DRAFT_867140 [Hyaloscypha finlandica]
MTINRRVIGILALALLRFEKTSPVRTFILTEAAKLSSRCQTGEPYRSPQLHITHATPTLRRYLTQDIVGH